MIDRIDNRAHLGGLAQYQQRVRERGTRSAESVDGAWASDGHAFCPPDNWEHVQVWASETYVFAQNWRMDQDLLPASIEYNQV